MSYNPYISVVIPTFNRVRQVQAALMIVLIQTYQEFEAIVVDDGSTDETGEAVSQLIQRQHSEGKRIRYFFQPNQGPSAARNKGIAEACGEWVAFLDSDDVWFPEKLEWQIRSIEEFKDECGACIADARLVDSLGLSTTAFYESGKRYTKTAGIISDAVKRLAKSFDHFWLSALLVRTDLAKRVGQFDSQLACCEDNDFLFRLSLATSFCYVNKPLLTIDRSLSPPGSKCRPWDQVEVLLQGKQTMFEKWMKLDLNLTPDVQKRVVRNLRQTYSAWTNWYLENQRYEEAQRTVSKALGYEITWKLAIKYAITHLAPSFARRVSPKCHF